MRARQKVCDAPGDDEDRERELDDMARSLRQDHAPPSICHRGAIFEVERIPFENRLYIHRVVSRCEIDSVENTIATGCGEDVEVACSA